MLQMTRGSIDRRHLQALSSLIQFGAACLLRQTPSAQIQPCKPHQYFNECMRGDSEEAVRAGVDLGR